MTNQNENIAEVAIRFLRPGTDEPLEFLPCAPDVLEGGLEELLGTSSKPKAELETLINLGVVLNTHKSSPTAAEIIRVAITSNETAMTILQFSTNEDHRAFAKLGMADEPKRAPVFGAAAPNASLKLSNFLTPGQELGALNRKRAKAALSEPKPEKKKTKRLSGRRRIQIG